MTDLLIGGMHNLLKEEVEVWYKSARDSGFEGDIVLLAYNEPQQVLDSIAQDGVIIVKPEVDHLNRPNTEHIIPRIGKFEINRLRFYDIWTILLQTDYRYVITTDVRDVVFQSNPIPWLGKHMGEHELVVGSEGLAYGDSKYNSQDMIRNYGPFIREYLVKNSPLVCCGVLAGTARAIKETSLMMYLIATGCQDYAEQAALNIMLSNGWDAKITTFDDGYIVHCGTAFDEKFSDEWQCLTSPKPIWKDGMMYKQDGTPVVIVHQYNRIAGAVESYRARYAR